MLRRRLISLARAYNVLFTCVVFGCGVSSSVEPTSPLIEPPEMIIERGDISDPKSPREVVFRVINPTNRPLKVLSMMSSCTCTVAKLPENSTVEPGQSSDVTVSVSIPITGEQSATVSVQTDSPQSPELSFRVIARGTRLEPPFITVQPSEIRSLVYGNADASQEFNIDTVEVESEPDWLSEFAASSPDFQVELLGKEVLRSMADHSLIRRYRLKIKAATLGMNEPPTRGWLLYKTARPATRESASVTFFFQRSSLIDVVPNPVRLQRIPGTLTRTQVTLILQEDTDWSCELVESPTFVSVTSSIDQDELPQFAKRFSLVLAETAEDFPERIVLRFLTSISSQKTLEVPLIIENANGNGADSPRSQVKDASSIQ